MIDNINKEEIKELKLAFLKSEDSILYRKASKIYVLSIIGIVIACFSAVFDFIYKPGFWYFVMDGLLFIFSFIFVIKTKKVRQGELVKFIKKKRSISSS